MLCDFKQRSVTQTLTVPVMYAVAVEAERMVRMYTCYIDCPPPSPLPFFILELKASAIAGKVMHTVIILFPVYCADLGTIEYQRVGRLSM